MEKRVIAPDVIPEKKKPRIAVASYILGEPDPARPAPTYLAAVHAAGGLGCLLGPVLSDEDEDVVFESFDGLILAGGADIGEAYLGEPLHKEADPVPPERDETEFRLAKRFIEGGKPVLGICRGAQVVNVAMGGKHDQHIFDREEVNINHRSKETRHPVTVVPGTLLASIFPGQEMLNVNSTHHQAVKVPAPGFTVNAMSPDGVIEACASGDRILLTQWHPERLIDEGMLPVFLWFIEKCREL